MGETCIYIYISQLSHYEYHLGILNRRIERHNRRYKSLLNTSIRLVSIATFGVGPRGLVRYFFAIPPLLALVSPDSFSAL